MTARCVLRTVASVQASPGKSVLTAGVAAALGVELAVAEQLHAAHEHGVEDGQGVDIEGQVNARILRLVVHLRLRRDGG